ncbi:MAG: ice-binding family protein [Bacteroidia bacterium]
MMQLRNIITAFVLGAVVFVTGCKKNDDPKPDPTVYPKVESTSPDGDATDVARNKVITANFSDAMDASSINNSSFSVKKGSTPIAGSVSYSGKTAMFEPSVSLEENEEYTATITADVKDITGQVMAKDVTWSFTTGANAKGLARINLKSSENYVILAKTAINNIPTSAITGDIAISPAAASYITGFSLTDATGYATSAQITGRVYAADMASPTSDNLTTAVSDMITAYNEAAGRKAPDFIELGSGNIGGKTLVPGLYKWSSTVTVPTNLVISGSASDVWIFQIDGNLSVSSGVKVTLGGGARPENIFWQVAGEVNLGTTVDFKGIILSMTGITLDTGAVLKGRALAQTAVILDANTITQP